jgi:hypothetical protein
MMRRRGREGMVGVERKLHFCFRLCRTLYYSGWDTIGSKDPLAWGQLVRPVH